MKYQPTQEDIQFLKSIASGGVGDNFLKYTNNLINWVADIRNQDVGSVESRATAIKTLEEAIIQPIKRLRGETTETKENTGEDYV